MFGLASGFYQNYMIPPEVSVLFVGLDGAGKTTLLERVKVTDFDGPKAYSGKRIAVERTRGPASTLTSTSTTAPTLGEGGGGGGHEILPQTNGIENDRTIHHSNRKEKLKHDEKIETNRQEVHMNETNESKSQRRRSRSSLFACPSPGSYRHLDADTDEFLMNDSDADSDADDDGNDNDGNDSTKISNDCIIPLSPTKGNPISPTTSMEEITQKFPELDEEKAAAIRNDHNNSISNGTFTLDEDTNGHTNGHAHGNVNDSQKLSGSISSQEQGQGHEEQYEEQQEAQTEIKNQTATRISSRTLERITKIGEKDDKQYDVKAGKTMFPLHLIRPTLGMNLGKMQACNAKIRIMDLGGTSKMRPLWERYYADIHAIAFVVDVSPTCEVSKLMESRAFYRCMRDDELLKARNVPVLVFANKSDTRRTLAFEPFDNENEEYTGLLLGDTSLLDIAELFLSPPRGSSSLGDGGANSNGGDEQVVVDNVAMFAGSAKSGEGVRAAFDWLIAKGIAKVREENTLNS